MSDTGAQPSAMEPGVYVIQSRCKECGFCIEFCPKNVLERSKGFNEKGYHYPDVARIDDCNECQTCENICPDFAIFVVKGRRKAQKEALE